MTENRGLSDHSELTLVQREAKLVRSALQGLVEAFIDQAFGKDREGRTDGEDCRQDEPHAEPSPLGVEAEAQPQDHAAQACSQEPPSGARIQDGEAEHGQEKGG